MKATHALRSRYIPVVGRAFLLETLYGSKYSPHMGTYQMPYLYVKTLLLCAAGRGLTHGEGQYVRGLVEALLPSNMSDDNLTKLELLQFVDAVPSVAAANVLSIPEPGTRTLKREANDNDDNCGEVDGLEENGPRDEKSERQSVNGECRTLASASLAPVPASSVVGGSAAELTAAASFISAAAFPSRIARIVIYDAASTCLADGVYSAVERERVALVAAQVGLSSALREEIERLAMQERIISARKRRLLNLSTSTAADEALAGASSRASAAEAVIDATLEKGEEQRKRMMTIAARGACVSVARVPMSGPVDEEREDVIAYVHGGPPPTSRDASSNLSRGDDGACHGHSSDATSSPTSSITARQLGVAAPAMAVSESQKQARALLRAVRAQEKVGRARATS